MGQTQKVVLSKANGDSMPSAQNKDWKKQLFQPCWDQGGEFKKTKAGWSIRHPSGTGAVSVHLSVSDFRGLDNCLSDARGAGFDI